jgi:hypothetical protein
VSNFHVTRKADAAKGVLTLEDHRVYHFEEDRVIRKFYQLYLFRQDFPGEATTYHVLCNFGPGKEPLPHMSKGGVSLLLTGRVYGAAERAFEKRADEKIRGGYFFYNAPNKIVTSNSKLLAEMGLTAAPAEPIKVNATLGKPEPAFAPRPAERTTRGSDAVATLTDVVTQMSNRLTELVAAGDVVAAITQRAALQTLVTQADHMVVDAKGRLEMLNALLAAEVSS